MAPKVMLPDRFTIGDLFAACVLAALFVVMLAGIAFPTPLRRLTRRWH